MHLQVPDGGIESCQGVPGELVSYQNDGPVSVHGVDGPVQVLHRRVAVDSVVKLHDVSQDIVWCHLSVRDADCVVVPILDVAVVAALIVRTHPAKSLLGEAHPTLFKG